jgi:hypothetical protein
MLSKGKRRRAREKEREDANNLAAGDRCPSNKNKTQERERRERRRLSLLITRRWCTTTTEHLFFLFFSLSVSFTFAVVDHRSIRDKEIEQHTTIIISWARRDNTMVGYMIKKNKTTVRVNKISFFFFSSSFIRVFHKKKTDDTCPIGWQNRLMRFVCDKMTYRDIYI